MAALKRERRPFEDRETDDDGDEIIIKSDGTVVKAEQQQRDDLAKLEEYINRAHPMIMQINQLFNQWVAGVEAKPPHDRWTQLKFIITGMEGLPKPTQAWRFRFEQVHHLYMIHKARWEKLMSDVENGRIVRRAGPKNR